MTTIVAITIFGIACIFLIQALRKNDDPNNAMTMMKTYFTKRYAVRHQGGITKK